MLLGFLSYGGLASCALGGLLALVGLAKGKQARQLGAAVPVDSLSGTGDRCRAEMGGPEVPGGSVGGASLFLHGCQPHP